MLRVLISVLLITSIASATSNRSIWKKEFPKSVNIAYGDLLDYDLSSYIKLEGFKFVNTDSNCQGLVYTSPSVVSPQIKYNVQLEDCEQILADNSHLLNYFVICKRTEITYVRLFNNRSKSPDLSEKVDLREMVINTKNYNPSTEINKCSPIVQTRGSVYQMIACSLKSKDSSPLNSSVLFVIRLVESAIKKYTLELVDGVVFNHNKNEELGDTLKIIYMELISEKVDIFVSNNDGSKACHFYLKNEKINDTYRFVNPSSFRNFPQNSVRMFSGEGSVLVASASSGSYSITECWTSPFSENIHGFYSCKKQEFLITIEESAEKTDVFLKESSSNSLAKELVIFSSMFFYFAKIEGSMVTETYYKKFTTKTAFEKPVDFFRFQNRLYLVGNTEKGFSRIYLIYLEKNNEIALPIRIDNPGVVCIDENPFNHNGQGFVFIADGIIVFEQLNDPRLTFDSRKLAKSSKKWSSIVCKQEFIYSNGDATYINETAVTTFNILWNPLKDSTLKVDPFTEAHPESIFTIPVFAEDTTGNLMTYRVEGIPEHSRIYPKVLHANQLKMRRGLGTSNFKAEAGYRSQIQFIGGPYYLFNLKESLIILDCSSTPFSDEIICKNVGLIGKKELGDDVKVIDSKLGYNYILFVIDKKTDSGKEPESLIVIYNLKNGARVLLRDNKKVISAGIQTYEEFVYIYIIDTSQNEGEGRVMYSKFILNDRVSQEEARFQPTSGGFIKKICPTQIQFAPYQSRTFLLYSDCIKEKERTLYRLRYSRQSPWNIFLLNIWDMEEFEKPKFCMSHNNIQAIETGSSFKGISLSLYASERSFYIYDLVQALKIEQVLDISCNNEAGMVHMIATSMISPDIRYIINLFGEAQISPRRRMHSYFEMGSSQELDLTSGHNPESGEIILLYIRLEDLVINGFSLQPVEPKIVINAKDYEKIGDLELSLTGTTAFGGSSVTQKFTLGFQASSVKMGFKYDSPPTKVSLNQDTKSPLIIDLEELFGINTIYGKVVMDSRYNKNNTNYIIQRLEEIKTFDHTPAHDEDKEGSHTDRHRILESVIPKFKTFCGEYIISWTETRANMFYKGKKVISYLPIKGTIITADLVDTSEYSKHPVGIFLAEDKEIQSLYAVYYDKDRWLIAKTIDDIDQREQNLKVTSIHCPIENERFCFSFININNILSPQIAYSSFQIEGRKIKFYQESDRRFFTSEIKDFEVVKIDNNVIVLALVEDIQGIYVAVSEYILDKGVIIFRELANQKYRIMKPKSEDVLSIDPFSSQMSCVNGKEKMDVRCALMTSNVYSYMMKIRLNPIETFSTENLEQEKQLINLDESGVEFYLDNLSEYTVQETLFSNNIIAVALKSKRERYPHLLSSPHQATTSSQSATAASTSSTGSRDSSPHFPPALPLYLQEHHLVLLYSLLSRSPSLPYAVVRGDELGFGDLWSPMAPYLSLSGRDNDAQEQMLYLNHASGIIKKYRIAKMVMVVNNYKFVSPKVDKLWFEGLEEGRLVEARSFLITDWDPEDHKNDHKKYLVQRNNWGWAAAIAAFAASIATITGAAYCFIASTKKKVSDVEKDENMFEDDTLNVPM